MKDEHILKRIPRACGRHALIVTRALVRVMPYPLYRILSRGLIVIGAPILIKKRKLALDNLRMAFREEKSEEEIQKISRNIFETFGKGMIDMIYFADRPKEMVDRVTIEGQDHLDEALKQGNGAVLVSAHFGNFILMYFRLVLAGYKTNVIMKRTRDPEFEKYISEFRDDNGLQTIYDLPQRQCVQQCLKALRRNEVLVILLDQNYGSEGRVFVDFFGRPAATAAGPVVFSARTGAPILPAFIQQDAGELRHKIRINPPVVLGTGEDEGALTRNVALLTKIIEEQVRQVPHEWGGWMHKRWKTRTLEEQALIDNQSQAVSR